MSSSAATPEIDFAAIQAEVEKMTPEQRNAELLKTRVRQKKQQKRQQDSGAQKAYQAKQRERFKAMKALAIARGEWDKINEDAEAKAEAEYADENPVVEEIETA